MPIGLCPKTELTHLYGIIPRFFLFVKSFFEIFQNFSIIIYLSPCGFVAFWIYLPVILNLKAWGIGGACRGYALHKALKAKALGIGENRIIFKACKTAVKLLVFAIGGKFGGVLTHKTQENVLRRQSP